MDQLIQQAEELRKAVKRSENKIDNPVLVMSIVNELDNFIEYLKEEEEYSV